MSARDNDTATMVALRVLEVALPLGVATVQAIRAAIEAARPDVKIADPPPASRYAEILAEDEATIARRFGGHTAHPALAPSPRLPGEALGTPSAASIFRAPPDGFGPKGGDEG